jgi:hypothetical protein
LDLRAQSPDLVQASIRGPSRYGREARPERRLAGEVSDHRHTILGHLGRSEERRLRRVRGPAMEIFLLVIAMLIAYWWVFKRHGNDP